MKNRKRILTITAILSAFSIFFSAGYITGNRSVHVSAPLLTQEELSSGSAREPTESVASEPSFSAETETTAQQTEASSEPPQTTPESDEPSAASRGLYPIKRTPTNAAEAVALFNEAANRVKSDQPKVLMTLDRLSVSEVLFGKKDITSAISPINRNDRSRKEILPAEFPVGGETWSSRLQADAVQSAECTDSGDTLRLKITLKPESGVPLRGQSSHGSCFSIPSSFDFLNFDIPGIKCGELTLTYSNCSIECVLDKKTGGMTRADYHIEVSASMQLTLAAILKKDCSAAIVSDTSFEMEWE